MPEFQTLEAACSSLIAGLCLGHASCESPGSNKCGSATCSLSLPRSPGAGRWEERKGCLRVPVLALLCGGEASWFRLSSAAAPAGEIYLHPHGTSSSHLKWEERGGSRADFPPGLNLSQLLADRLQKPGEDKQRRLVGIFQSSLGASQPPRFLPTFLGEELCLTPAAQSAARLLWSCLRPR